MAGFISPQSARSLYNLIGRMEDSQAFYEDPALDILLREGNFASAASIFEFGCGTGRLAERLMDGVLSEDATFTACDISPKMVALTRQRLARFGSRSSVFESLGDIPDHLHEGGFDRIVTTYVLDLMPPAKIEEFFSCASKALVPGGLLCAASIAPGETFPSSAVMRVWNAAHSLSPMLTGGCRPLDLPRFLAPDRWSIVHASKVTAWGVTSGVLIASPR